ncbi:MAG: hypothetical protein GTO02_21065 [Candidatus Dadabacteria bacterium]|nr:hypothetical protein [Candidatus Dadabacteria bacterium]NIQ16781.1 hypothetical protein [Candidatus Dadabacteria bacterium]
MSSFWKFLNSPLIVVLIALAIWPVLTVLSSTFALKLGIDQISQTVSEEVVKPFQNMGSQQDEKLKAEFEVLKNINVSNVSFAPTSWSGKAKIIGTLTNNSRKTVKGIHLTASLKKDGKLINVNNEWLSRIKAISPGSSVDFSFTVDLPEGESLDSLIASVKVADLGILE